MLCSLFQPFHAFSLLLLPFQEAKEPDGGHFCALPLLTQNERGSCFCRSYPSYLPIFTYPAYAKQIINKPLMITTNCHDKGEGLFLSLLAFSCICIISTSTV